MPDQTPQTDFSAADAALGYLYQVRLALLSALERVSRDETFAVYLETLDDVVFEPDGTPAELLQLKHHRGRVANLTDASPDLWKSLRVWMEGRTARRIPEDARLYLVTTGPVGPSSAAALLGEDGRDEAAALQRLEATAATSVNETNQPAYERFRALSSDQRRALGGSVTVLPGSPDITAADDRLRRHARLMVRREHVDALLSRLEGWWYRRAVAQLADAAKAPILSVELEGQVDDLREQFRRDALPVDEDILAMEVAVEGFGEHVFVRQAELAGIRGRRILAAVRDYYRAFTQRSRWLREDLLLVGELDGYERKLQEEWEIQFERQGDRLGEAAGEDAKVACAGDLRLGRGQPVSNPRAGRSPEHDPRVVPHAGG